MGLNETLDRLAREREAREARILAGTASLDDVKSECEAIDEDFKSARLRDLAERVFFGRMLKDINHGMSEPKIDELIDRSVMIAEKLFNRLYR